MQEMYLERYSTYEDALAGHEYAKKWLEERIKHKKDIGFQLLKEALKNMSKKELQENIKTPCDELVSIAENKDKNE